MARLAESRVPCAVQMGNCFVTDKASILSRWSEHFFSADRVLQDPAVLRIPQQPFKAELDEVPFMKEITKAIEHLRSDKAVGVDGIPAELWKEWGAALHSKLHKIIVCCWEQSKLPRDLCDAIIVSLYKNKGQKSDSSN